jgi:hypothetical protein
MKAKKELTRIAVAVEDLSAAGSLRPRRTDREQKDKLPIFCQLITTFRVSERASIRATNQRRALPIMGYVGPNGGGKSACMVKDTIPSLKAGRTVLSTVTLLDPATGEPHPNYVRFTDWDQLLDARDCDILMDEMVGIAGSRESARLPVQVQNILVQLRRRNVVLRWSAPAWGRADKIVREVTQAVTECRGYFADHSATRAGGSLDAVQLWAPKRLFTFRTYDTLDFDEWTAGKRDRIPSTANEWFLGVGSDVFQSYNTLDAVERVGDVSDAGLCAICNGTRPRKTCKCGPGVHAHVEKVVRDPAQVFAAESEPTEPTVSDWFRTDTPAVGVSGLLDVSGSVK